MMTRTVRFSATCLVLLVAGCSREGIEPAPQAPRGYPLIEPAPQAPRGYPFPPGSEIVSMQARSLAPYVSEFRGAEELEIPKERWQEVLDALNPSEKDSNPADWEHLCVLQIETRRGESHCIWMFSTARGPGAFKVGKQYYRGGETARLIKAIAASSR